MNFDGRSGRQSSLQFHDRLELVGRLRRRIPAFRRWGSPPAPPSSAPSGATDACSTLWRQTLPPPRSRAWACPSLRRSRLSRSAFPSFQSISASRAATSRNGGRGLKGLRRQRVNTRASGSKSAMRSSSRISFCRTSASALPITTKRGASPLRRAYPARVIGAGARATTSRCPARTLALGWTSNTFDFTAQVSKLLLFIVPYVGAGYTIGNSSVTGGLDSKTTTTGSATSARCSPSRQTAAP